MLKNLSSNLFNDLETDRLLLEKVSEQDYSELFNLFTCSVGREFLGGKLDYKNASEKAKQIILVKPDFFWVIKDKNKIFIGTISLDKHHDSNELEVSYQLKKESFSKGYARESLQIILNNLKKIGLNKVLAETQMKNIRSINLLENMKFVKIKKLKRFGEFQILFEYTLN